MRATRRTFRTAAIATGAIAALAVPTTAAFAADATPTPHGQVAQDDQTSKDQDQDQGQGHDQGQDDTGKKDETGQKDETGKDETGQDKDKDKDKPVPGGWESKGTTDLGKGWSAKVDVNASARTAKAAISLNGEAKGSLTAYEKSTSTKIDGNTFTLTPSGAVTMQAKPTPPKPQPQPDHKRTLVREYKNLGGTGFDAKVYKVKGGYEADMIAKAPDSGKKTVWDTLKQAGSKAAYGQHNGAHFVLNPDGTMKGWVDGKTHGGGTHHNGTKPQPQHETHRNGDRTVPRGGVKAGADGVTPASDDAPLIAAGGGMAAVGAAGLGFALYRRKQNG
ncbi:hypothetical protein [Streptomyces sp. NPDC058308]|uniref:hypothetical protein n=1 Tax=Streptomyces sp. NPDC058308 TaxID=3346440 RepID=UPI0036EE12F0